MWRVTAEVTPHGRSTRVTHVSGLGQSLSLHHRLPVRGLSYHTKSSGELFECLQTITKIHAVRRKNFRGALSKANC